MSAPDLLVAVLFACACVSVGGFYASRAVKRARLREEAEREALFAAFDAASHPRTARRDA